MTSTTYTDFLDQPIAVGDRIVFAQAAHGGGAVLKLANIHALVPLVDHPDPYPRQATNVYAREDQMQGSRRPTEFRGQQYTDPSKRYVIQILVERGYGARKREQKYTIPYSNSVIKVPS